MHRLGVRAGFWSLFVASESDSDGGASTTLARYPVKRDDAFSPPDDDSEAPPNDKVPFRTRSRRRGASRGGRASLRRAPGGGARGREGFRVASRRWRRILATAASCSRRAVARWRRRPSASLLDPSDPFVPGGALGRAAREGFAASERRFVAHSDEVADVAFCADGRRIVTVGAGGDAFAWDVFDDALKGLPGEAEAASETTTTPADGDHASAGDRPPSSDDDPIAGRRLAREAAAFARRRVTDATPLDPSAAFSFSSAAPPPRGPLAPRNRAPDVPPASRSDRERERRPRPDPRWRLANRSPRPGLEPARTRCPRARVPSAGAAADGAAGALARPEKNLRRRCTRFPTRRRSETLDRDDPALARAGFVLGRGRGVGGVRRSARRRWRRRRGVPRRTSSPRSARRRTPRRADVVVSPRRRPEAGSSSARTRSRSPPSRTTRARGSWRRRARAPTRAGSERGGSRVARRHRRASRLHRRNNNLVFIFAPPTVPPLIFCATSGAAGRWSRSRSRRTGRSC